MKFFKTLMNLGKIKEYAKTILFVIIKSSNILNFLEKELENTDAGNLISSYLPKVKDALDAVRGTLTKILEFFGEEVEVSALSTSTIESELEELNKAVSKLK